MNGGFPRLLDVMDIPVLRAEPHMHQTENYLIDTKHRWVKVGELPSSSLRRMVDQPETLWTNRDRTRTGTFNCVSCKEAATPNNSLTLIRPDKFAVRVSTRIVEGDSERSFQGAFSYNNTDYVLKLT